MAFLEWSNGLEMIAQVQYYKWLSKATSFDGNRVKIEVRTKLQILLVV